MPRGVSGGGTSGPVGSAHAHYRPEVRHAMLRATSRRLAEDPHGAAGGDGSPGTGGTVPVANVPQ
jgi:hypothetical protein